MVQAMETVVREARREDEWAWRELWAGYLSFYETELPAEITNATWDRILDPASPMFARVAERDDRLLGFAVALLHESSWTLSSVCYLEDLFVTASARSQGVGRALIADLTTLGKARGWSRLYWHTRADNARARRMYDSFVSADDFVRYRIALAI